MNNKLFKGNICFFFLEFYNSSFETKEIKKKEKISISGFFAAVIRQNFEKKTQNCSEKLLLFVDRHLQ